MVCKFVVVDRQLICVCVCVHAAALFEQKFSKRFQVVGGPPSAVGLILFYDEGDCSQ